jgi:hypothetical protein
MCGDRMRKLHDPHVAGRATLQPRAPRPSSNAPVRGPQNRDPDSFMPKLSVLLEDMCNRGPMRSAAFRDLRKLAPRFDTEMLWEGANLLLKIIKDKDDDPFERMEAVKTIVSVLNAIRRKMAKEERGGVIWSAESQVPVQDALPKIHPGSVLHATAEEIFAEKRRFGRMECAREQATIGSLNAVALVETFDNREIADAVRKAIISLDSPYAKKLVNRMALANLLDPLEKAPEVKDREPSEIPEKPKRLEEIFEFGPGKDVSEVG